MSAIRFGRELAAVFVVPYTLVHRRDDSIVEAVRASGLPANVSAGGQGAKDAVDGGAGVSGHAPEILDAQAGAGLTQRLYHANGLEHRWDNIAGISGIVRILKHLDPPPHSDFRRGAVNVSAVFRLMRVSCAHTELIPIVRTGEWDPDAVAAETATASGQ
jgi:hypothetical protein